MNPGWIKRSEAEPPIQLGKTIIVWGEGQFKGVIAVHYDYDDWIDVVDGNPIDFHYWQPAPESPYR